ncbi:protein kinase-like protein [Striga asiatica]|uniref:Protein kinase-like protein n=1 Tax=Striga asiatica TaxID=4170 RepID=A0A5A7P140_STRAF|nr:protein kinase-like protein [Striga asiatica]
MIPLELKVEVQPCKGCRVQRAEEKGLWGCRELGERRERETRVEETEDVRSEMMKGAGLWWILGGCGGEAEREMMKRSEMRRLLAARPRLSEISFSLSPFALFRARSLWNSLLSTWSPGFLDFLPYVDSFKHYPSSGLQMNASQLVIDSLAWQRGPRLRMYLKIFPPYINDGTRTFNRSEVMRIGETFGGWKIPESGLFGPYEYLNFTLVGPYSEMYPPRSSSGLSKRALAGVIVGTIAGSVTLSAIVSLLILRRHLKKHHPSSKRRPSKRISIRIEGMKNFSYSEMALATNNFNSSTVVGQGGYGKVHKGILSDGTVVAIKRAQEGSLQGDKEFLTEIELLSRLHHRNLVSLVGYCDDEGEQMLVYHFMSNGTLRDHLSGKSRMPLNFSMRVKIALGSARGILYLHTEANPPIFHRDIKATNILLDSNFIAKVADFGLSRLAPVPELEGAEPSHVSIVCFKHLICNGL